MMEKVLALYSRFAGCDYHRIMLPLSELGVDLNFKKTVEDLKKVEIIFFNRIPLHLDKVLKSGKKLVMDLDDYWNVYPGHPQHKDWVTGKFSQRTEDLLKKVDGVMVTTPRLADRVRPFNKNVWVVPNAIPFRDQFLPVDRTYKGETRFGYIGGSSHLADVRSIEPTFRHFPKLNFTLFGYHQHKTWDLIEDVVSYKHQNPNYRRVESASLDTYMYRYDNIDVAIAPLADNDFNRHKSSLKFYEAGAKKCSFIATDMSPYADDVPRDTTFLCKSNKEWVEAIKKCGDLSRVRELGEKNYEWVREHRDMAKINQLRVEIFNHIMQKG